MYNKRHIKKRILFLIAIILIIMPLNAYAYSLNDLNVENGQVKLSSDILYVEQLYDITSVITDYSENRLAEFNSIKNNINLDYSRLCRVK